MRPARLAVLASAFLLPPTGYAAAQTASPAGPESAQGGGAGAGAGNASPGQAGTQSGGQSSGVRLDAGLGNGPNGLFWRDNRVVLVLADGNFTISPVVRTDVDGASFFDQNRRGGFQSGTNLRRGYLGVRGTFLQDFEYNFTWNLGGYPASSNVLYEASLGWKATSWLTFRGGAFTLQHLPEFANNSYNLLFMERASISTIAASLASGITRFAVGQESRGERWNTSFYVSAGLANTLHDEKQRGLVGRAVYVALDRPWAQIQVGFDGAAQFRPGTSPGADSERLRDYPELRGGNTDRFVDSASILADDAYTIGPELAGRLGPVYVEALYQHIAVDRTAGGTRSFDGWYAEAAVPVLGKPRERDHLTGTWARPKTEGFIDPLHGNWGAVEVMARYSAVDLRDSDVRGGRQRIWTVGTQWYLSPNLKLHLQYEHGTIDLDAAPRDFQAIGFRVSFTM